MFWDVEKTIVYSCCSFYWFRFLSWNGKPIWKVMTYCLHNIVLWYNSRTRMFALFTIGYLLIFIWSFHTPSRSLNILDIPNWQLDCAKNWKKSKEGELTTWNNKRDALFKFSFTFYSYCNFFLFSWFLIILIIWPNVLKTLNTIKKSFPLFFFYINTNKFLSCTSKNKESSWFVLRFFSITKHQQFEQKAHISLSIVRGIMQK